MRVILFTGKGGVGKTTAAAASATLAAEHGYRTLVISTDTAHSLADTFAVAPSAEPAEVAPKLFVQQIDTQQAFERTWREVQEYLVSVLHATGVDSVAAEELTVLPGAEEVLALLEVRDQVRSGRFDAVLVDCAPTAETLRLLALPEALGWYVDRIMPIERRVVSTMGPVLTKMSGVPMPRQPVYDALRRLHEDLAGCRAILTNPATSVRLVLTPESVVVAEARRTLTTLSLYGYRVDAVAANRLFPAGGADAWRAGWVAAQAELMTEVEESFAPLTVYRSPYRPREPVGTAELASFAADTYGGADPCAPPDVTDPIEVRRLDGDYELALALPFAERGAVDLARKGDELVITVGGYRRVLAVPDALRRCTVADAALEDGRLRVRFRAAPKRGSTGTARSK